MAKYGYAKFLLVEFFLLLCARFGLSGYTIPPLQIEAFKPSGFRVSIPDDPGLKRFAFNGKINGHLSELQPGELAKEVNSKDIKSGRWVYENQNVKLRVGDYIGYWVFVQHNFFGYRKDNQTWQVEELRDINEPIPSSGKPFTQPPSNCEKSVTVVDGNTACRYELVFQDDFNSNELNTNKWIVEQYIPINGPNFEFNYYSRDVVHVEQSKLRIKPEPKQNEEDIRGTLDLKPRCTSTNVKECVYKQLGAQYLPPVKSGKIKSKFSFKYGRIEIAAKLPCGDWIYPEISLIPNDLSDKSKIYVAYSRGNSVLRAKNGDDIGATLLLSGYISDTAESNRSLSLSSTRGQEPFCRNSHNYTVIWKPDKILAYVDGTQFGQSQHGASSELNICLGVSVGGINDFPDDFTSTNSHAKPWKNQEVLQFKNFFTARNLWLSTWSNKDGNELIVDSVRVFAL